MTTENRLLIVIAILFTCWAVTFALLVHETRRPSKCTDLEIRKLELEIEGKQLDLEITKAKAKIE